MIPFRRPFSSSEIGGLDKVVEWSISGKISQSLTLFRQFFKSLYN